jgi:hypothetical protein
MFASFSFIHGAPKEFHRINNERERSFKLRSRPIEDSAKSTRLSEQLACMINPAICGCVCVSVTLGLSSFASPLFFVNDTVAPGKKFRSTKFIDFFLALSLCHRVRSRPRCVHFNFDCSHRHCNFYFKPDFCMLHSLPSGTQS